MKHAVVTGATGFIAVHLIDQLIQDGYHVHAVVRPSSVHINRIKKHERLTIIELDMRNITRLKEILKSNIDEFYHLAWEGTRSPQNEDQELQNMNYRASLDALNTAVECGCITFVGAGSQAEYGFIRNEISETSPLRPITEYGKSKLRTYEDGFALAEKRKIRFIWTRIFSVYGVYDFPSTLISTCIQKMMDHAEIQLGPCTQDWDYIYIDDAVDAIKRLGRSACPSGAYNIASGLSRPLMDFINEIKEITCSKSMLRFGANINENNNQVNLKPNIDKLREALNWEPRTKFADGIRKIIHSKKETQT